MHLARIARSSMRGWARRLLSMIPKPPNVVTIVGTTGVGKSQVCCLAVLFAFETNL